jgi:hypothetical protein
MDAQMVKAVEMTRHIRERNIQQLSGKSYRERIAFYREQAQKMEEAVAVLLQEKETLAVGTGIKLKDS